MTGMADHKARFVALLITFLHCDHTGHSLRHIKVEIWLFFCVDNDDNNDNTADYFIPCACAQGNKFTIQLNNHTCEKIECDGLQSMEGSNYHS